MNSIDITGMLAEETYFTDVIGQAAEAGLVLLGRATIDTNHHRLRRPVNIMGTEIPTTIYLRTTTLAFHLPGKALCLVATYVEELTPDFEKARRGVLEITPRHPYWKLDLFLGTITGMSWGSAEKDDEPRWLNIDNRFRGTTIDVRAKGYAAGTGRRGSGPYRVDEDLFDCDYGITLGYYPDMCSSRDFGEAMHNLLQPSVHYIRDGRLGRSSCVDGIAPHSHFACSDVSFWAQLNPTSLEVVFENFQIDPVETQRRTEQVYGS